GRASAWTRADRVGRDAGAAPRPRRVGTTPASARWRGEFARVEESVAIHVLLAKPLGKTREMLPARQRRALAPGLLIRRQHAIAIAVHAVEGIAHPGLVFGKGHAAIAVGIHLRQVFAGLRDLGEGRAWKQAQDRDDPAARGDAAPYRAAVPHAREGGMALHQARAGCSE